MFKISHTLVGRLAQHILFAGCCAFAFHAGLSLAQQPVPGEIDAESQRQLDKLSAALAQTQAQLDASQRQLEQLKQQLAALRLQTRQGSVQAAPTGAEVPAQSATQANATQANATQANAIQANATQANAIQANEIKVNEIQERQAVQQSELATLDQSKVESDSKYPVKLTGLILFNAFTNSASVDLPATPTIALGGHGSTGASFRQTLFGIDARGPTLLGAASRASARVDFFGAATQGSYNELGGLLRLRTAQATLTWPHAEAFVSLERPLISPLTPTSLTAVAEPALAWSGNLWVWAPQAGARYTEDVLGLRARAEVALIDVPDPPGATGASNTSLAESSRRPGTELRLSLLGHHDDRGAQIGVGGYFSPHRTSGGSSFNAWAGTLDYRLPIGRYVELSGTAYRGQALGGLGGGGYEDFVYQRSGDSTDFRALEDVGGWSQAKYRASERLQFNAAFGMDNVFAGQLRPYAVTNGSTYQNIARNQTLFSNVIWSPSAYLLFSLEYRHLLTAPVNKTPWEANIFGLAAGYRF